MVLATARVIGMGVRRVATALLIAIATPAEAAEVKVLSAGAVRSIVTELAVPFRDETGHTVTITGGTVGELRQKLAAGEQAHVVIMSDTGLDQAIAQGLVVAGSRTDIARTAIGVAVLEGAPRRPSAPPRPSSRRCSRPSRSPTWTRRAARRAASTSPACSTASGSRRR